MEHIFQDRLDDLRIQNEEYEEEIKDLIEENKALRIHIDMLENILKNPKEERSECASQE